MDKYQIFLIEIEAALNSVIKCGLDTLDTYGRGRRNKKLIKESKTENTYGRLVPPDVAMFERTVNKYGCVDDLDNMRSQLSEFAFFLKRHLDDTNMVISMAAREMHPLIVRLMSLMHIARAHPNDALKRAKNILNTSKPTQST
jgi:hypothetical protein